MVAAIVSLSLLALTVPAVASDELAEVRAATAPFHRVVAAVDAGWGPVPGLDHCFENPGVGAMGYHYIDTGILFDADVDPRRPEALVYAPGPNGRLRLAAVEWIVPATLWTGSEPPMVLGRHMHLNTALGVWVLHAWIFQHNPAGMFEDWNPRVSCS
jgi:hypothetical protein